ILGEIWGVPPALDVGQEVALQKCLRQLIQEQNIESAHDCSEGGLAVALAESTFFSGVGAAIDLAGDGLLREAVLFGEDATRVVISCDAKKAEYIRQTAVQWNIRADRIGRTVPE